jgi:hypothetical protein
VGGHDRDGLAETVFLRRAQIVANGAYQGTPGSGTWLHRAAIGTQATQITGGPA